MNRTTFAPRPTTVCHCRFTAAAAHHDRLLRADTDLTAALDLLELAVTWGELDYSQEHVIPPRQWLDFAADHRWADPDAAERVFSLAVDIALCAADRGTAALARS